MLWLYMQDASMSITWLLSEDLGLPGRLGLSHGPGCLRCSRDEDLMKIKATGATLLVCLQEPSEFLRLEPPETLSIREAAVAAAGLKFLHVPIEDYGACSIDVAKGLVATLLSWLQRGDRVVIHCHAGLGRSGMIAACVLVRCGYTAVGAIAFVRWVRPGAIQSEVQEQLVGAFADGKCGHLL